MRTFVVSSLPLFTTSTLCAESRQAAVVMPDAFSAEAAAQVLERGGNAVDAAIAMLNVVAFGMDAQNAVDNSRFRHQLWPRDQIRYHAGMDASVLADLEGMG